MSFENDLKRAKEQMFDKMSKIVRGGAVGAFNAIIVSSPVDTGRFRGNWQASINTPKLDTLFGSVPKGEKITQVTDTESNTNGFTLNDILYLTNNLPYAQRLENGWSQKRGSGWVAAIVSETKSKIQSKLDNI